jgi:hypothetical protein
LNQILKRQTSRFHYGSKVPAVTITVFITILEQVRKRGLILYAWQVKLKSDVYFSSLEVRYVYFSLYDRSSEKGSLSL